MNLFEDCVCEYYNSSSFCCERTIDTIQICVHGLFFTVFLVFLLALNWMAKKASVKPRARNFVHLPLHKTRWMLLLQLVPCQLALVVEGILIGAMYHVEFLHLCVPYIIGALCTSMSLAFYDRLEKTRTSKPLAVLLLYWNISLGSSCVKNVALYCSDDKWSARLVFSLWVTVTYLILVTVEVIVLHKMKYMCKSKVTIQAPEEAHSLTYVHSQSCFLSQITWHWLTHILIQGYRKPLHLDDLGQLPKSEQTEKIYETFRNVYEEEKMKAAAKGKQLSLWKCYWRHSGKIIIMTGILKLLSDNMLYIGPVLLGFLVDIIQDERDFFISNHTEEVNSSSIPPMSLESYFTNSYIICLLMTVISVIQVTMTQNMSYFCSREGIRIKAAVQSLVYSKSLQLPESTLSDGQMSVGRVINHLSTDAVNILMLFYLGHFVWAMPIQILVGLLLLYYELGVSALLSGLLIVLMVPIQYLIGRQISSLQSKVMVHSDKRLKQSGELLHNIRLVKLYVWESLFTETVLKTRNQELKCLLLVAFLRVLSLCVCDSSPVIACLLTFTLHSYWSNEPLRASRVFASLAIFGFLSNSLFIITLVINVFCFGAVSTRRLEKFMMSTEVEEIHDKDVDDQLPLVQYKMSSVGSVHLVGCEQSDGLTEEVEPMIADSEISLPVDQGVEMTKADIIIKTKHAYVTWQKDEEVFNSQSFTLKDVTVTVKKGELFMIVGPVGCGKSSLLSAFLGEMFVVKGQVEISRSEDIAYVPQKAWLMNATVRDNILFDKQFDADRYQSVLEMCALLPDLETLVAGDETEVGEKGVNLSGGQRQRINIARAIYSQPSLILMDDPLSALDASVAEHVFMNAIKDHLLKSGVTVVLVTHQMKYVTHAGTVCYLDGGRVLFQGKPCHLLGSGIDFLQAHVNSMTGKECVSPDISVTNDDTHIFGSNLNNSQRDNQPLIGEPNLELDNGKQDRDHKVPLNSRLTPPDVNTMEIHPVGRLSCAISAQSMSSLILQDQEPCQTRRPAVTEDSQEDLEVGRLVTEEAQTTGVVQLSVYLAYARAATWPLLIISLLGYSSRQALKMLLDYWLTLWISASRSQTENKLCYSLVYGQQRLCENNITKMEDNQLSSIDYYYMTRYLVITLVAVLLAFLTYLITEIMSLIAARALFKRLIMNIVRAPLRFFDITPVGRILNRMSGDVQIIDQKMVTSLDQVLYCTLFVLGVIIINTLTTPYFVLLAIPMFIAFFLVQRFYIASSRELQRLDCITKSPVLTHFSETLHGLSSIRAYKAKERMMKKLWKVVDDNNLALLFFHTTNAWMAIRLEYLSAGIIFAASICSVTVCLLGYISPEMVGLAVSYAIMVASFVSWSVRGMSEFEMWFNSVQRVLDYMDIESEKRPGHQDLENLPEDWPTCGRVIFDDVSISYDESLPPVIHHLSVEIKHGQKIGICGRTGSGKSTITLSMFSVLHICEGQIRIDGQDITRVPLDRLRVSIAIIPQDPVLFSGTIRYNLDPTHSLTDDEIWQALEVAQLKDVLSESPLLLESQVSEGGQNFSTGQRQLFCLARAILRHSQILIMDEATASVDFVTDRIIQDVIRTAFANKTVLTIAHRVSTIMACDMILVIEDGHLVECDTPPNLLATESRFATMLTNHQL